MKQCAVVIPLYNSATVLPTTIAALAAQVVPPGWHVTVVFSDDGSRDATPHLAVTVPLPSAWQRQVVTGAHGGPGAARNRAVAATSADIIFFLGADIVLRPGALVRHLRWHESHPAEEDAALGMVSWDPRVAPTPLMQWMIHGGPQNDFDALLGVHEADPRHFLYASHLSLKRTLLAREAGPFAVNFQGYGWEDVELGRRLHRRGLRLRVLHDAQAVHAHHYTVAAICQRQVAVGYNLVQYQRLHPTVTLLPPASRWRRLKYRVMMGLGLTTVLRGIIEYGGQRWSMPWWYQQLVALYFWHGVGHGQKNSRK